MTNADVALEATFENGANVLGESKIFAFKKEQDCGLKACACCRSTRRPCPRRCTPEEADLTFWGRGACTPV